MIRRRAAKFILIIFFLLCVVFAITWVKFLYTPLVHESQGYKYTVEPGNSLKAVINDLSLKGMVRQPHYMQLLMRFRGDATKLKAGEYLFPMGATPSSMLHQMVTATGLVYHAFTIIPGWTFKDVRHAMLEENSLRHSLDKMTDQEIMIHLGQPGVLPEGQFFPDTYYFAPGTVDTFVLKRAFQAMQTKLDAAWKSRAVNVPYKNPGEVLIVASLIEKEAYFNNERPIIAGVLINRLRQDMLLQIDPTVIYGMGLRYTGKIRKEDLLENTSYNTYVHKGLPPSPIAMPGLGSIMAAVHPENTTYLYYVARGDGSHQFSDTYIEHQAAVIEANKPISWFFNENLVKHHLEKIIRGEAVIPAQAGIHSK
jgi:UPF0755 protein